MEEAKPVLLAHEEQQQKQTETTGLAPLPVGYAVNEFGGVYKIGSTRTYQEKLQVAQTYTAISNAEGCPPSGNRLAKETKQSIGFCKRIIKEMEEKGYVDLPSGSCRKFGPLTEEAKQKLVDWYTSEPHLPYREYASRLVDQLGIKCSLATMCKFFQTQFPKGRRRGPQRQHTPVEGSTNQNVSTGIGPAPKDENGNSVRRAGVVSLSEEAKEMLIKWNKEEPNEPYKTYRARVLEQFGVDVSLSTISLFLKNHSDGPRKRGPRGPRKRKPEVDSVQALKQEAPKVAVGRNFSMPDSAKHLLCKWNNEEPEVPYRVYQSRLREQCGVEVSLATISGFLKRHSHQRYRTKRHPEQEDTANKRKKESKDPSEPAILMCGTYGQAKKIIDLEQENNDMRRKLGTLEQENSDLKVQVSTLTSQVETLIGQVTAPQDIVQEDRSGGIVGDTNDQS